MLKRLAIHMTDTRQNRAELEPVEWHQHSEYTPASGSSSSSSSTS